MPHHVDDVKHVAHCLEHIHAHPRVVPLRLAVEPGPLAVRADGPGGGGEQGGARQRGAGAVDERNELGVGGAAHARGATPGAARAGRLVVQVDAVQPKRLDKAGDGGKVDAVPGSIGGAAHRHQHLLRGLGACGARRAVSTAEQPAGGALGVASSSRSAGRARAHAGPPSPASLPALPAEPCPPWCAGCAA